MFPKPDEVLPHRAPFLFLDRVVVCDGESIEAVRRFDAGELDNVAGLDLPIDEPDSADLIAEHDPTKTVEDLAAILLNFLSNKENDNEN